MKPSAVFERSTSPTRPHVIVVDMGEGDRREMNIHEAQSHLESLGAAIADYIEYMESNETKKRG